MDNSYLIGIYTNNGKGSGIRVSSQGHILTCYHNLYDSQNTPETIASILIRDKNYWKDRIAGSNIKKVTQEKNKGDNTQHPQFKFAKEHDLFCIHLDNKENCDHATISTRKDLKINEKVTILALHIKDEETPDIPGFLDCIQGKITGITREKHEFEIKYPAYKGMSGGGIFDQKGELIGVIKKREEGTNNNIVASCVYHDVVHSRWSPLACNNREEIKQESNVSDGVIRLLFREDQEVSDTIYLDKIYIKKNGQFIFMQNCKDENYKLNLQLWENWNIQDCISLSNKFLNENENVKGFAAYLKKILSNYLYKYQYIFEHIQIWIDKPEFFGIPFDQIQLSCGETLGHHYKVTFLSSKSFVRKNITLVHPFLLPVLSKEPLDSLKSELESLFDRDEIKKTLFILCHSGYDLKKIQLFIKLLEISKISFISHRGKCSSKFLQNLGIETDIEEQIRMKKAMKDKDKQIQDIFFCGWDNSPFEGFGKERFI